MVQFLVQHVWILDHLVLPPHNLFSTLAGLTMKMVLSMLFCTDYSASFYLPTSRSCHFTSSASGIEECGREGPDLQSVCGSISQNGKLVERHRRP
jgi:hypothetical protein